MLGYDVRDYLKNILWSRCQLFISDLSFWLQTFIYIFSFLSFYFFIAGLGVGGAFLQCVPLKYMHDVNI